MAKYQYSALKNNNQIIKGEVDAATPREAREKIRLLGFVPTKIYTEETNIVEKSEQRISEDNIYGKQVKRLSLQEKIMFTSELQVLLSAGIPVIEALQTIENNSPKWKIKAVCYNIRLGIISGMTFAQSLTSIYSKVFGPVYTAMVKTGEEAGELDVTLERMLTLLKKQDSIKGKIISASIYPGVLLVIMFGVMLIFTNFVFPAFYGVIQNGGGDVPAFSMMLIGFCEFFKNFWWLVLMGIGAGCCALTSLFKNPSFKSKWDEFILKIPIISEFIKYINLANFMTVLHISYDAGLPIMSGLELSNKTVGNYTIKRQISNAVTMVQSGKTLSEAFGWSQAIPPALLTMISTGEKSGTLGKMFHDAAEVIDKKVDMALEAMTKLFEPAVIVIMGGAVLFIAVGFYQLYYSMLGSLF